MGLLQLKIVLGDIKPKIWRRFVIDDSIRFHKLHEIIQEIVGWENYHLYEFSLGSIKIGLIDEYVDYKLEDAKNTLVSDYMKEKKQKILYTYDFGDTWEHLITIEKIFDEDSNNFSQIPICLDGERACPPEDCGGEGGYENLLEISRDKNHPDYEDLIVEWLGDGFDFEKFDIKEINNKL